MTTSNSSPGPKLKVARLINEYDLVGVGDELEAKWTHPEDRQSLRDLADFFNKRLITAILDDTGIDTLTGDVSHLYAILNGTEGSRGNQTQLKQRLERNAVDVEKLLDDFVTYQAIRSYLTKYRDASPPTKSDEQMLETEMRTIEQLRERTATVTESKLDRLKNANQLQLGPCQVFSNIQVYCESCGKQYNVGDLLRSGSCECYEE